MIALQPVPRGTREVRIGQPCEFLLTGCSGPIESQFFVEHNDIRYLKPLTSWSWDPALRFFPESPGRYTVYAHWRTPDGRTGRSDASFEVVAGGSLNVFPQLAPLDAETKLWVRRCQRINERI